MVAHALSPDPFDGFNRRSRARRPRWVGSVVLGAIVLTMVLMFALRAPSISHRDEHNRIINVVLPPPPPPPPPPKEQPPRPEKPKPIDEPKPTPATPPPPTPQPQQPTPGDDALTARTGAGPSNYGLAEGNGGGTRIGGAPGGNSIGWQAYAETVRAQISSAAHGDTLLSRGSYRMLIAVAVDGAGRITDVKLLQGGSDRKRSDALQRLLTGMQISKAPPPGLPVMRIELNASAGA